MGPFLRGIKLDAKVLFVGYEMIVMMFAFKVAKTRFYLPFKFSKSSWNPLEVSVSFVTLGIRTSNAFPKNHVAL